MGVAALGEKGVVELVSIIGYYTYVALTCNTFEVKDPELPNGVNAKAPWEADAALVSDAELATLVAKAKAASLGEEKVMAAAK